MKMLHTPGPWYAVNYGNFWQIQSTVQKGLESLFELPLFPWQGAPTADQAAANAILAAGAPEMAAALIAVANWAEAQEPSVVSSLLEAINGPMRKAGVA
jgi:cytochrome c oxidase assembly factor CtaG